MPNRKPANTDPEIEAIGIVYEALRVLDPEAQRRVLKYVAWKIGAPLAAANEREEETPPAERESEAEAAPEQADATEGEATEGVSPVAIKWMKRSGLTASGLSALYSLGVDEIDLVAQKIPGDGTKERMHSVLLLKGIAAYLSTGAARVTHEQLKEACLHYDAFDTTNFVRYLKSFSAEVSGAKESGYTLKARGMTNATETIKGLTSQK